MITNQKELSTVDENETALRSTLITSQGFIVLPSGRAVTAVRQLSPIHCRFLDSVQFCLLQEYLLQSTLPGQGARTDGGKSDHNAHAFLEGVEGK